MHGLCIKALYEGSKEELCLSQVPHSLCALRQMQTVQLYNEDRTRAATFAISSEKGSHTDQLIQ